MTKGERKTARRHLIYFSEVRDQGGAILKGHLADISTSGLMILTKEKVEEGRSLRLEVLLPEEVEGRDRIRFRARSLWCRQDVNPDYYATGLSIEEIDMVDRELIEYLIFEYGFNG